MRRRAASLGRESAPGWGTTRNGPASDLESGGSTHGQLHPRGRARGAVAAWSDGYRPERAASKPVDVGMLADASEGPVSPLE